MNSLTIPDVAKRFGVSKRTVEVWIESGELNAINVSRNRSSRKPRLRVLPHDLDVFIASRSLRPSAPPKRPRAKRQDIPKYV